MRTELHASLLPYNTFGIEAEADRLVHIESLDEVERLPLGEPLMIVGRGSNLVPTGQHHGTVVVVDSREVRFEGCCVEADAGVVWDELVEQCLAQGLYGMENLSAIPGTVGASVVQNIGAYGVEVGELVERVWAYDLAERRMAEFEAKECRFGYRSSLFKQEAGRWLVLRVRYRLSHVFAPRTEYAALQGLPCATAHALREAIVSLRWGKLPRPEEYGSAGSFFKNPVVEAEVAARLVADFPDMPQHPTADGRCKLSAAWLIDRAGWKGRTLGRVGVWPKQALVLYNTGGCTGSEVQALASAIQADVRQRYGVGLEPEAIFF